MNDAIHVQVQIVKLEAIWIRIRIVDVLRVRMFNDLSGDFWVFHSQPSKQGRNSHVQKSVKGEPAFG